MAILMISDAATDTVAQYDDVGLPPVGGHQLA